MARDNNEQEILRAILQYEKDNSTYFDSDTIEDIVRYYLDENKNQEAVNAANNGILLYSDCLILKILQAEAYLRIGRLEETFDIIKKISDLIDTNDEVEYEEWILLRLEIDAIQHPFDFKINKTISQYLNSISDDTFRYNDFKMRVYYVCKRTNHIDIAHVILNSIKKPNDFIELQLEKAICYMFEDQFDTAREQINKIIDNDPYDIESWTILGETYAYEGKYTEAIEAFEYAHSIDDKDVIIIRHLAYLYNSNNIHNKAIEMCNHAEALGLDIQINSRLLKAESLIALNRYQEALDVVYEAFKVEESYKTDASYAACVKECFLNTGRIKECYLFLEELVKSNPNDSDLWLLLGETYYLTEKLEESLDAYRRSLEFGVPNHVTLWIIGNIYMELENPDTAIYYFKTCEKLVPTFDSLDLSLAICHYKLNDNESAVKYLQKAYNAHGEALEIFTSLIPQSKEFVNQNIQLIKS